MPTATRPRYTDADRERVAELAAAGLGYKRISQKLGIPRSTVFRWLHPAYAERQRRLSREAKRRRVGVCERCGAETRYHGHADAETQASGASRLCLVCAAEKSGLARTVWTREKIVAAIRWWASTYGSPPAMPDFDPWRCGLMGDWKRMDRAAELMSCGQIPSCTWVVRRFGSWNAALVAAGFKGRSAGGGGSNALRRRSIRDRV